MADDKKKQLIIMINLCSSVAEGAEYLIRNEDPWGLRQDILNGLSSLESGLKGFGASPSIINNTQWIADLISGGFFRHGDEFSSNIFHWYCSVVKELKDLMVKEFFHCPFCQGTGEVHYTAALYRKQEEEDSADFIKIWMRCKNCGSYYLSKDLLPYQFSNLHVRRLNAKAKRLSLILEEKGQAGTLLFVGREEGALYLAAARSGLKLELLPLKKLEDLKDSDKAVMEEAYEAIIIEHFALASDPKTVLENAQELLAYQGFLWLDIPDMEKHFKNLAGKGKPMWNGIPARACLSMDEIANITAELGLSVKEYNHVGRNENCIEIIMEKKLIPLA